MFALCGFSFEFNVCVVIIVFFFFVPFFSPVSVDVEDATVSSITIHWLVIVLFKCWLIAAVTLLLVYGKK